MIYHCQVIMADININGIVVNFPFKPYPVQEEYMAKVIECLQNSKHGVLESPTGTGKTLSLLCSSLSWLLTKKAQLQAQSIIGAVEKPNFGGHFFNKLSNGLEKAAGLPDNNPNSGWGMPKIIYASRTHSQLSQAMQELKRTSYKHVNVAVLGSRDQLCVHPEISKEPSTFNKIHMCHAKVKTRTCFYFNNIETRKVEPVFKEEILDIEDLVKAGQKMRCCPYFLSKELKQNADIVFMPYNYLLDPKTRKSQGIDITNNIIILDEAHNVEKTCEEAASLQISSTDVAMCIDEITAVMKDIASSCEEQTNFLTESSDAQKDFTPEDLCILKAIFLQLEKAIDDIKITKRDEGEIFPGAYIFELLEKAELTHDKKQLVIDKLEKIVSYLTMNSTSSFTRKGNALQKFSDLLKIVFSNGSSSHQREKVTLCYKVYVQMEEQKSIKKEGWQNTKVSKSGGKIISYWCFSPGFGMQQLIEQGARSIILTSGTLSPLKPFISELGIPIDVELENPHIVTGQQLCVGILSHGPDGHQLNSSFNTRNDPRYIASLGRTVYNFSCLIPNGLLVFFPSYPIMKKCREEWQTTGLWTTIMDRKPIYVEPQSKEGFTNIMHEYYQKIQDPTCKGAIFMAVCRGKVSEGLDFANANGRAVIVTGLPFPPLKDPRIILKQKYLDEIRIKNTKNLSGQQWYQLEASRAVNQAIGRIIRHKNDYGAILLCDCRFEDRNFKAQLPVWLKPHIKNFTNFGMITKDLREFFRYAMHALPQPKMLGGQYYNDNFSLPAVSATFDATVSRSCTNEVSFNSTSQVEEILNINHYTNENVNINSGTEVKKKSFSELLLTESKPVINFNNCKLNKNVDICDLTKNTTEPIAKKRKIKLLPVECNTNISNTSTSTDINVQTINNSTNITQSDKEIDKDSEKRELGKAYLKEVKKSLTDDDYKLFATMIKKYTNSGNCDELLKQLEYFFPADKKLHLFTGFKSFLKKRHISQFEGYLRRLKNVRRDYSKTEEF